jgi:chemotaxis protein MotB
VKFKSDVTFNSGDATVTPKAKEVITKFSSILNSPGAAGYELIVAGHTDSTHVVNPGTIKAGHKDNWFLSAHRAISVAEQLQDDHVSPQRIGVTGYADQRPIASNASDSGRAQNRRVEVLILPNQVRSAPTMASAGGHTSKAPMKSMKDTEMSKDAAIATPAQPTRPVINK